MRSEAATTNPLVDTACKATSQCGIVATTRRDTLRARSELADDPRFALLKDRASNVEVLDDFITEWTQSLSLVDIERTLTACDVPASRIFSMADIFADPHYAARGAIVRVKDEALGDVALAAPVPRLSRTPGDIRHAGRAKGQDTVEVLSAFGFAPQEIESLVSDGSVQLN
jgi:crotonobetainyl-CoA:carnitine CoA-transferase CaiB-like acyl-CoA transferase